MRAKLDRDIVRETNDVKLLRITSDNNLKFDKMCLVFAQRLTEN